MTEIVASASKPADRSACFVRPSRPRAAPHIHQTEDEFFYVVSGKLKFKLGDRIVSAPAESVMFVPRGTAHTFQNVGLKPRRDTGRRDARGGREDV